MDLISELRNPFSGMAAEGYLKYSFATEYGCDVEVLNSVTSRHLYHFMSNYVCGIVVI